MNEFDCCTRKFSRLWAMVERTVMKGYCRTGWEITWRVTDKLKGGHFPPNNSEQFRFFAIQYLV